MFIFLSFFGYYYRLLHMRHLQKRLKERICVVLLAHMKLRNRHELEFGKSEQIIVLLGNLA